MGTIKDRNGMDLTEAEDIKKRWQEYTEKLHKNNLHDPDNHDGMITHLEPDILECKVKWPLRIITMWSTSLIIREMKVKTTMRYHYTPVRMAAIQKSTAINAGEGVEKREPSYTVGGNAN